jgi:uncharacterized membrane protein YbhN (UPF0104 family)
MRGFRHLNGRRELGDRAPEQGRDLPCLDIAPPLVAHAPDHTPVDRDNPRARRTMRDRLRDPALLIPLVLTCGLLAYVSSLAAAPHSSAQLWLIVQRTWLLVVLLIPPYLAARLLVWDRLLAQVGLDVPWRHVAVAFAVGEMTKSLPAGVYLQNYLLARLSHLDQRALVRSTLATTALLGLESAFAVPVAVMLGVPGAPWARQTILGIVLAWIVVLLLTWWLVHDRTRTLGPCLGAWRRRLVLLLAEFLAAGGDLITRQSVRHLVPTALYMLIYTIYLYAIMQAAGVRHVTFVDTLGLYALLVLAVTLVPLPTEIGLTEITGLGALVAYGVPGSTAALIMLSLRVLATGATILAAGALLVVLRHEVWLPGRAAHVATAPT